MSALPTCECGCGEPAPLAARTYTTRGHVKGEPVRFIAGHNLSRERQLTASQVRSAYTLYLYGFSVRELAERSWRNLGCSTEKACEQALYRAFHAERRRLRTNAEAVKLRHSFKGCAGCDCPLTERTPACDCCNTRHHRWQVRGLPHKPPFFRQTCIACDGPLDQQTPGCRACYMRLWRRRHVSRLRRPVRFAANPPSVTSSGSGHPMAGDLTAASPGVAPTASRRTVTRREVSPTQERGRVAA